MPEPEREGTLSASAGPAGADPEGAAPRSLAAATAPPAQAAAKVAVVFRLTMRESAGAAMRVGGLTVLERALRQARHLGHQVSVITDGGVVSPELPPDLAIVTTATSDNGDGTRVPSPHVVLPADMVWPSDDGLSHELGRDLAGSHERGGAPAGAMRVTDEPSRRQAEDAVFANLLRGDLGFVARRLNKPLSFALTRHVLCRTAVTPDQVTIVAALVGLIGCVLVATGRPALAVLGLLLAHGQSVLDGCDGELARLRFAQTARGAWLDTVADDVVNVALVAALAVGIAPRYGALAPALTVAACVLLAAFAAVAYRELARSGRRADLLEVRWWFTRGQSPRTILAARRRSVAALVLALGRRDFFLLAWPILGAFDLWQAILVHAFAIAAVAGIVAGGQLLANRRPPA